ncbi:MAG: hypothetical protein LBU96_14570 [Yokenella regensburgei]|nr:hypothetical protein [Yokenella regensburgei]
MFHFNELGKVQIISMTPANPGWYLRIKEDASDDKCWYVPVACWALCRFEDGDLMLPCVPNENGEIEPNDPNANPCDLAYLPNARPLENKEFHISGCDIEC